MIADDLGVESAACYAGNASMPWLTSLCDQAFVAETVWSSPTCSPTRAALLSGQYSFRTGVGEPVSRDDLNALDPVTVTLPSRLAQGTTPYATANFGKWHLGGPADQPNRMGWDHYAGTTGGGSDYFNWRKTVNGETTDSSTYLTTELADDAIDWIADQTDPWLAWVAFTAPHTPFHLPPSDLHTNDSLSGDQADIDANPLPYYNASLEALDTEMQRLVNSLTPEQAANTIIIFIGDNGNPSQVSAAPRGQAKGSLYPGGIQVPMMVWGPDIAPQRYDGLVATMDLHATILDFSGVPILDTQTIDSVSFADTLVGEADSTTQRTFLLSESFGVEAPARRQGQTIRTTDWQLIATGAGDELFDLTTDPLAQDPLAPGSRSTEADEAFDQLSGLLAELS